MDIAQWCNGNTKHFGRFIPGSNPGWASNYSPFYKYLTGAKRCETPNPENGFLAKLAYARISNIRPIQGSGFDSRKSHKKNQRTFFDYSRCKVVGYPINPLFNLKTRKRNGRVVERQRRIATINGIKSTKAVNGTMRIHTPAE